MILGHLQMLAMCAIVDAGWPNLLEYAIAGATTTSSVGAQVVAPMCLLPQEKADSVKDGTVADGIGFRRSSLYYNSAAVLVLPVVLLGAVVAGAALLQAVSDCRQAGCRACCRAWTSPFRRCFGSCSRSEDGDHRTVSIPDRDRVIFAGGERAASRHGSAAGH